MNRLTKFWALRERERQLLYEAAILLSLSPACLKTIPFRHIDKFLRAHWKDSVQCNFDHEEEIDLLQRSISRAAHILPWENLCLSRSIAKFIMLRRRGIRAVIFAGARFCNHSSLEAHAWVDLDIANNKSSDNFGFAP